MPYDNVMAQDVGLHLLNHIIEGGPEQVEFLPPQLVVSGGATSLFWLGEPRGDGIQS